jgi:DNA-binding MarR family transcriptional regulator
LGLFNGAVLNYFMWMGKSCYSPPSVEHPDEPAVEAHNLLSELVCTNTALRRAARRLGHLYDEALAPLDLKATQLSLLTEIARVPPNDGQQGPTLQDLAARLAIQISALTHALRPLVRDGLVEVRQDVNDRRAKHGILTPLGKARLREALVLWDAANRRVEVVLGPASAAKLRDLADEVASEEFLHAYAGVTLPPISPRS